MHLESNLSLLSKDWPDLVKRIISSSNLDCEVVSKNNMSDWKFGEHWKYGGNFNTNWDQVIDPINSDYPKLVIVYGFGAGNHIRKLLDHPNFRKIDHLLIVEKDIKSFKKALETDDYTKILSDERIHYMIDLNFQEIHSFLMQYFHNHTRLFLIKTLTVIVEPNLSESEGTYYHEVARSLKKAVDEATQTYMGSDEDAYRGFMNIVNTLPLFKGVPFFDSLQGKFKDYIGIAVSTGPSLKHSLKWLKTVQNKAIIACSDSALGVLLKEGIEPHLVGCLERVPETKLLFDNLPSKLKTHLVCSPVVWPETIEKYTGPLINQLRPIGQLCWFYKEGKVFNTGNSVSHLLFESLKRMGCSKIMLLGQDLAFDRFSERTHVEGVPDLIYKVGQSQRSQKASDGSEEATLETVCQLEGNNGKPIDSMKWYSYFKLNLEWMISSCEIPVYNVIPEDYGAKILGASRIDPSEALNHFNNCTDKDIFGYLNSSLSTDNPALTPQGYTQTILARLTKAYDNLRLINTTALEVLDALSSFKQTHSTRYFSEDVFTSFFRKIEKIANSVMDDDEDKFYDNFFYAQVLSRSAILQQFSGELLQKRVSKDNKVAARFSLSFEWFGMLQTWSARMARYIERQLPRLESQIINSNLGANNNLSNNTAL